MNPQQSGDPRWRELWVRLRPDIERMARHRARRRDLVTGWAWVPDMVSEAAVEVTALVWLTSLAFAASIGFFLPAIRRGLDREAQRWARWAAKDRRIDQDFRPWRGVLRPYLEEGRDQEGEES
jgi:hypothetical protein